MKKKVLIIQEYFPIYRKPFFDKLAKSMDLTVLVSNSKFSTLELEEAVPYIKITGHMRPLFFSKLFWQDSLINYDFKDYDLVVLAAAPRNLSYIYLMFYFFITRKPTLFWGHLWSSTSTKFGFFIRMLLLKLGTGLVFYTENECIEYKKTFFGKNDNRKCIGLNNGLDISVIDKYREKFEENRLNNILFIGRLTTKSNLMDLLQAINLSENKKKLKLHIVGDGDIKEACKRYANENNLVDSLVFYGSIKDEEEISNVANKCCAFVYPGDVGLSLIHAMSYGLPCVVHNNIKNHGPEIAALIESNGGVFFEKNNLCELKRIIDCYVNDIQKLKQDSFRNLNTVRNDFNIEKMSEKFESICSDIFE